MLVAVARAVPLSGRTALTGHFLIWAPAGDEVLCEVDEVVCSDSELVAETVVLEEPDHHVEPDPFDRLDDGHVVAVAGEKDRYVVLPLRGESEDVGCPRSGRVSGSRRPWAAAWSPSVSA